MHITAQKFGKLFFETYLGGTTGKTIVDLGALDVNGSLRSLAPPNNRYIGVDFAVGNGVDITIEDPYSLPFDDGTVDVCVSSSCFEHSEMFWLVFNEILRILRPGGLLYLNVPSNGPYHRYPVDCWRFYPDSGIALETWGKRSGYDPLMLESFIGAQGTQVWNDFVAVFVKDTNSAHLYPNRMKDKVSSHSNGWSLTAPNGPASNGSDPHTPQRDFSNLSEVPEGQAFKVFTSKHLNRVRAKVKALTRS